MLPTEQQIKDAAPEIAAYIDKHFRLIKGEPCLLVNNIHGIYVPYNFCAQYTNLQILKEHFEQDEFESMFDELLTAINEHTPEPYTVFWHEGALFYGDESAFFDEWTTDPDTTPVDPNQEPF